MLQGTRGKRGELMILYLFTHPHKTHTHTHTSTNTPGRLTVTSELDDSGDSSQGMVIVIIKADTTPMVVK